ncbi:FAD-binding domain-containing protein [Coniophora puteana RWD-64-598 SS2]|uniref:FAD-binding domain-containing protein n=1 Tax=Coniophora puteana (strain RWD-64-598) TaxID=741705 RepID=A0A5M3MBB1_CONPW|nr:FAD-binding domain-containing protein [Coniophora puteana RWD-64-598 SS2]EIW76337.1 FAD-binding domain-containing protein [Coniophora puteana RWD-64-598 SS2]
MTEDKERYIAELRSQGLVVLTKAEHSANEEYKEAIAHWSDTARREAQYVFCPRDANEVSKAIAFATKFSLEIAIKGGGHSCSGASASNDVLIDLGKHINTVAYNEKEQLVTVGGGAVWQQVDEELSKHGRATVGGTVQSTGVGGLTVGGGYGFLSGQYGLAIDNLVRAQVVLADGTIANADDKGVYMDLFWGIRGGGSNFGPVTSFTFKTHPVGQVWTGLMTFPPILLEPFFNAAQSWFRQAKDNEAANIFIGCSPLGPGLVLLPFYNGSEEDAKKSFGEFLAMNPGNGPPGTEIGMHPYMYANTLQNLMTTAGDHKAFKATKFNHWDIPRFEKLFKDFSQLVGAEPSDEQDVKDLAADPAITGSSVVIEFYPHNHIGKLKSGDTAFANRAAGFGMLFVPRWKNPDLNEKALQWARARAAEVDQREEKLGGSVKGKGGEGTEGYSNYGSGNERSQDVFGGNYARLQGLKAKYDPGKVFNKWFPIEPTKA